LKASASISVATPNVTRPNASAVLKGLFVLKRFFLRRRSEFSQSLSSVHKGGSLPPESIQLVTFLLLQHPPASATIAYAFRGPTLRLIRVKENPYNHGFRFGSGDIAFCPLTDGCRSAKSTGQAVALTRRAGLWQYQQASSAVM
jgi:hypothetical protein